MTQPASLDACRHGYLPGGCVKERCSHSARARALYIVPAVVEQPTLHSPFRSRALEIAQIVATDYEMNRDDLLGTRKFAEFVEPRWALYWVCRHVCSWSWSVTHRALMRDRTAIMVGARKTEQRMQTEPKFKARVERLARMAQEAGQ